MKKLFAAATAFGALTVVSSPALAEEIEWEELDLEDEGILVSVDELDDLDLDDLDDVDLVSFDNGSVSLGADQEAESGDVEQTFEVSGGGDNANQTAGIQGVANTGNAQDTLGFVQIGSEIEDIEFDEVGSSIEVDPELDVGSEQSVEQSASTN